MKLIVGLGNPGKQYLGTRHNVGFDILERLAENEVADPPRMKFQGKLCEGRFGGEKTLLLSPQTYMNRSGASVRQAVDFYKISSADVLVVCDDFHLPLGRLRMRSSGSDGGQKGLADILRQLATSEVARLRVGIGPVPAGWDPADFVLGKFGVAEQFDAQLAIGRAAEAARTWVIEGIDAAMNQFNQDPNQA
jgi:PTH1 family peptidyl-tRNA hydrolase